MQVSDIGNALIKQFEMKLKAFVLILFMGGLFLSACQKDIDIFVPDPGQTNGPDTSWHSTITATMPVSILKNELTEKPYLDSIEVNASTATVVTPTGLIVTFPPWCTATSTGQPVTGNVQVEVQVVRKKGDMIRLNKPSTLYDSLLVTAGHIFITLRKNGALVVLAPNVKINIRYIDLPIQQQMKLHVGDETNPSFFNWLPNPDPANNTVGIGSQAYEIYTNRLRWISLAYGFNVTNTSSVNVTADIPSYFTNANTVAFTVFKDFRSVVAMHGEFNTRKFVSGRLPLGKQITVVVISKQGNDYYLGHTTTVTQPGTGTVSQSVHVVPIKKSFPEILSYLSTL